MKNLQNLIGAKALNKQEQQSIKGGGGGFPECESHRDCPTGKGCCFAEGVCLSGILPPFCWD